jgi:hypothetical protein
MKEFRNDYNRELDEFIKNATDPERAESLLLHEAAHLAVGGVFRLRFGKIDVIPYLKPTAEKDPDGMVMVSHIHSYAEMTPFDTEVPGNVDAAQWYLRMYAACCAAGVAMERKLGRFHETPANAVHYKDFETLKVHINETAEKHGKKSVPAEEWWEAGMETAGYMLDHPPLLELVKETAAVLSRFNGQEAVRRVNELLDAKVDAIKAERIAALQAVA